MRNEEGKLREGESTGRKEVESGSDREREREREMLIWLCPRHRWLTQHVLSCLSFRATIDPTTSSPHRVSISACPTLECHSLCVCVCVFVCVQQDENPWGQSKSSSNTSLECLCMCVRERGSERKREMNEVGRTHILTEANGL